MLIFRGVEEKENLKSVLMFLIRRNIFLTSKAYRLELASFAYEAVPSAADC
jgi:hypothetical protein